MEVTVALLENAMKDAIENEKKFNFLIDGIYPCRLKISISNDILISHLGFPRQMDQGVKFEEDVCPSKVTLFFECPEEVMLKRLLKRGETSGRSDDNIESIKKRFRTFIETSYPVVEYFEKLGKVVRIDATDTPEVVYARVKKELTARTPESSYSFLGVKANDVYRAP